MGFCYSIKYITCILLTVVNWKSFLNLHDKINLLQNYFLKKYFCMLEFTPTLFWDELILKITLYLFCLTFVLFYNSLWPKVVRFYQTQIFSYHLDSRVRNYQELSYPQRQMKNESLLWFKCPFKIQGELNCYCDIMRQVVRASPSKTDSCCYHGSGLLMKRMGSVWFSLCLVCVCSPALPGYDRAWRSLLELVACS